MTTPLTSYTPALLADLTHPPLGLILNYYASEVNDQDDNPPIGIILCTEKDSITAEYALGGLSNNIFASRYVLYMPNKEQLIAQVEAVLKKRKENESES